MLHIHFTEASFNELKPYIKEAIASTTVEEKYGGDPEPNV